MLSFLRFLREAFKPNDLRALMNTTTLPSETKFILPDGTRLKMADNAGEHRDAVGAYNLGDVLKAGVIRYRAESGVSLRSKITEIQARLVADDWNTEPGRGELWVDVELDSSSIPQRQRQFSTPVSASVLRSWVNKHF